MSVVHIVPLCTCIVQSEDLNTKHCVPLCSILKLVKMYEEVLYSCSRFVLSLLVESQKILLSKIRKTLPVRKY